MARCVVCLANRPFPLWKRLLVGSITVRLLATQNAQRGCERENKEQGKYCDCRSEMITQKSAHGTTGEQHREDR